MSASSARAHAGGTLSAHLAHHGVDVVVVEGGPKLDTRTAFNTHAHAVRFPEPAHSHHAARRRRVRFRAQPRRRRQIMTWNAVAWRLSHRDFKGRSIDGAGEDWPIDYPDLAPYYDRIEREVGVCGNLDHLEDLPDGIFLPPVPMKCSDQIVQARRGQARRQSDSRAQGHAARVAARRAARLPFLRQLHGGLRCGRKIQLGRRPHGPGARRPASSTILSEFHRARGHGLDREPRHRRPFSRSQRRARRRSARALRGGLPAPACRASRCC